MPERGGEPWAHLFALGTSARLHQFKRLALHNASAPLTCALTY
ncbi:hypothetical protein [Kitasatospora phosalacinea]|nr:hypothetical protein [Kitasatospora phosalacinea]